MGDSLRIKLFSDKSISYDIQQSEITVHVDGPDSVFSVTATEAADIKKEPTGESVTLKPIKKGSSIAVLGYKVPDIDKPISGEKYFPLSDGSGWVCESQISALDDRTIIGENAGASSRVLHFSDGTNIEVPYPRSTVKVPDNGTFVRVLHDYETTYWDKKPRVTGTRTAPETCQLWECRPDDFIPQTREFQLLWFLMLAWASHGAMTLSQLKTAWADMTAERKALTDNHGLRHRLADYILGLYTNHDPLEQKCLAMGGSLLKVVSESANYYNVECIDMSAPIPSLDYVVNRPWLWGWTTEVTARVLPDGTYVVGKWPNLKHYGDWGTPYLLIGLSGTNKVGKERVVKVENGSEYSPYN